MWREILEYFDAATQLGLTATPKTDADVDTYGYFGRPLYSYSLGQGIRDGFVAPYRVRRVVLSPDAHGWRPEPGQLDRFGRDIPDDLYTTRDFERIVSLLTRTEASRVRRDHGEFFRSFQPEAREVLDLLLERYAEHGVDDLADLRALELELVNELGTVVEIARRFGNPGRLHRAVGDLQRMLYAA